MALFLFDSQQPPATTFLTTRLFEPPGTSRGGLPGNNQNQTLRWLTSRRDEEPFFLLDCGWGFAVRVVAF